MVKRLNGKRGGDEPQESLEIAGSIGLESVAERRQDRMLLADVV